MRLDKMESTFGKRALTVRALEKFGWKFRDEGNSVVVRCVPIYVGDLTFRIGEQDVELVFTRYGELERVVMRIKEGKLYMNDCLPENIGEEYMYGYSADSSALFAKQDVRERVELVR